MLQMFKCFKYRENKYATKVNNSSCHSLPWAGMKLTAMKHIVETLPGSLWSLPNRSVIWVYK